MFSEKLLKLAEECERDLAPIFSEIDAVAFKNTQKVMSVFRENRLSDRHFNSTCGYGYNDDGRDLCDKMFAEAFGAEEYGIAVKKGNDELLEKMNASIEKMLEDGTIGEITIKYTENSEN